MTPGPKAGPETRPMLDALARELGATEAHWTDGAWPSLDDADVVLSFAKFRHLHRAPTIDWSGFSGLRVHYDWDAFMDAYWSESAYRGSWIATLRRHRFDMMITTGFRSRDEAVRQGFPAVTVHKGFDPAIADRGLDRPVMFGTFGAEYRSRILMKHELTRAGVGFEAFRTPYEELAQHLNRYQAILICMFDAELRFSPLGRRLFQRFPRAFVRVGSSPEPMAKFFETAAAGAAPFVDWTPDLEHLGFRNGENAVIYHTFSELVNQCRHYSERPDELRSIGQAANELAHREHSWPARARAIRSVLERALRDGSPTSRV